MQKTPHFINETMKFFTLRPIGAASAWRQLKPDDQNANSIYIVYWDDRKFLYAFAELYFVNAGYRWQAKTDAITF